MSTYDVYTQWKIPTACGEASENPKACDMSRGRSLSFQIKHRRLTTTFHQIFVKTTKL